MARRPSAEHGRIAKERLVGRLMESAKHPSARERRSSSEVCSVGPGVGEFRAPTFRTGGLR